MSRTTPGTTTLTLQPLIDVLASKYASVDSEDVSFDTIAKSVLEQCVQTRDELWETHREDAFVSTRHPGTQLYYRFAERSIII